MRERVFAGMSLHGAAGGRKYPNARRAAAFHPGRAGSRSASVTASLPAS